MIMNINKGMAQLTLFHQQERLQSVGKLSLKNHPLRTEKKPNSDTDKQTIQLPHNAKEHFLILTIILLCREHNSTSWLPDVSFSHP